MRYLLFAFLFIVPLSCVRDKPVEPDYSYDYREGDKVYIIHEGNFMSGNASLSYYHFGEKILNHFIYETANSGEMLGDVFQSMLIHNDDMFLVINNSNKVIVADRKTLKKKHEIPVYSPRYMYPVNEFKFYITSLYSNDIHVFNTVGHSIEKTIKSPYRSPEKMVRYGDRMLVASWDTANDHLHIIDPAADKITDSIPLHARAPHSLLLDKYNRLWVWAGNEEMGVAHTLSVVDIESKTILKRWTAAEGMEWIKPCQDTDRGRVFWIALDYGRGGGSSGIYSMSVEDEDVPDVPLISSSRWQYYYALGWNPADNNLWVGDPKSFTEKSEVHVYTAGGEPVDSFVTQLGIGDFYFFRE